MRMIAGILRGAAALAATAARMAVSLAASALKLLLLLVWRYL